MAAFLLWNIDGKARDGLVQSLIRHYHIDIVLLVEYAFGVSQLSRLLMQDGMRKRKSPKRFGVFSRPNQRLVSLKHSPRGRFCLWRWTPPSGQDGLLVLLHGLDRRNYDDNTRRMFFHRMVDRIRYRENSRGHQRTIIAGDFNASPFESAVVAADGLHAIGVQKVGVSHARNVRGAGVVDFFYNPMWRIYGHQHPVEAGAATYYRMRDQAHELGWHMLDQVVVRPTEAVRFPEALLSIITQVGGISLLDTNGLPDRETASDHLPILFHWNL